MNQRGKFEEILAQYRRHGWRLARVLARPGTFSAPGGGEGGVASYEGAAVTESEVDAMWFARPSAEGREAWELRLVGDTPYALFELFEPDEDEEDREDVRREMEARMREYAGGAEEKGGRQK